MCFFTNNSVGESMRITSAGDVGIGTTSPSTFGGGGLTLGTSSLGKNLIINSSANGSTGLLQFVDLNGNNSLQIFGGSTEMTFYGYGNRPMSFYTNDSERMRITSSGNVGIGTTGPNGVWSGTHRTLQITGGTNTASELVQSRPSATITRFLSGTSSEFGVYTADALNYIIYTSGNERMRITSAGSMGLGITSPTATAGRFEASNDIVAFSTSDKRWKNNIVKIDSPLEKISQISGVEFDWIEDEPLHGNKGHDVGVIAQEIELIIPEAVQTRESGMKAVQYDKIIPLLIESIKEQQKQIDELKELVNKLTK
jgi:hypothetical protein